MIWLDRSLTLGIRANRHPGEVQRIPVLEKMMERMHAMLTEMYEDRQRQPGGSKLIRVSTGKRKIQTEDLVKGDEEGETSLTLETGAGQDRIKFIS
ncbi:gypsy/ty3 element polyprotein [Cucumis melo var. makuwa]|uniref:Gypsy/ty3 element polyprotein n=1 Tax=Cucumis melo var. makuwa TaxID=1194695 RepID=A0A5D3DFM3_CUCMM|nr:gypsy/ty3 element polyprotein [Cucumis melo var. makuwa]TYK22079.1 gypsy/ty3 element polyprotein [Cucumis melo var. makuwa]